MDTREAYDILLRLEINESKVLLQRLSVCSIVNSILLVAFFMAKQADYITVVRVPLAVIGIIFSAGFFFLLLVSAKSRLRRFEALCKLEKEPHFDYMVKKALRPFTDIAGILFKRGHIAYVSGNYLSTLFPLMFFAIWIIILIKIN